jgi:ABC-type uncharacterized transport system permease subunit
MHLTSDQLLSLVAAALRQTTPLALSAIGITISEASGVIHLAAEGIMLMAALAGVIASYFTGSAWAGLFVAMLIGLLLALVMGVCDISLKADQVITGFGINFLALGTTPVLLERVWGNRGRSDAVTGLPTLHWDWLARMPVIGPILDGQGVLFFLMIAVVVLTWLVFHHTPFGLRLRMAGENPAAVATAGAKVNLIRYIAVLSSGVLCGIAGAALSLGQLSLFGRNMVAGRGFVAVAANVVGGWRPIGSFGASLLFGAAESLQLRLQGGMLPNHFVQMIPYILTVLVVCGIGGLRAPLKLGVSFDPEEK